MKKPRNIFPVNTAKDEEQMYFQMIDRAMLAKEDNSISNGKSAHAVYLLYKFLAEAQQSVRIYTGNLMQVFDNVLTYAEPELVKSAISFLGKENSKLSIIIVDEPDVEKGQKIEEHPLLAAILKAESDGYIKGEVGVSRGVQEDWEGFGYHFTVMDDEAMRIEVDIKKAKAYVNFGNPDLSKRLANLFDKFERNSKELLSIPAAT